MNAFIVNNQINVFKTQLKSTKTIGELIDALDNILLALYSTIISLKMFFENQYPQLLNSLNNIEELILIDIQMFDEKCSMQERQSYISKIRRNLEQWLALRYRIDISVFYFQYGEIIDEDLVKAFFAPQITHTINRPAKSAILHGHEIFKENPWNMCSGYGIKNYFAQLNHGFRCLEDLNKKNNLTENLKIRYNKSVI